MNGPWLPRLCRVLCASLACGADAARAAAVADEQTPLYVCTAGICTDFRPPMTVACPTDTIAGLTDCAEANYRAALASDFGLLSEARVTVEGAGATVVLRWSAQRHSPYSAVLARAPASSYPRYWVTAPSPPSGDRLQPAGTGASLEPAVSRYSWERLNLSLLFASSPGFDRLYPGAGATVSPQYTSAEAACTAGFAYLQGHHAVGAASGQRALYDHGLCVLRLGTASVGVLPIHAFPTRPSAADAADGYGGEPLRP